MESRNPEITFNKSRSLYGFSLRNFKRPDNSKYVNCVGGFFVKY
jgi:hypothetical protein